MKNPDEISLIRTRNGFSNRENMTIYLDNHSTTRIDPRVLDAMMPWLTEDYGNAGSVTHELGRRAREAVDHARSQMALAIGAEPREVIFTSGATESINLAIIGSAMRPGRANGHLMVGTTDHQAVLDVADHLGRNGRQVTYVDVAPQGTECPGAIDPQMFSDLLQSDTFLVSLLLANNEIGVIHPTAVIANVVCKSGAIVHLDCSQAIGRMPVDVDALGADLASFSGHKFHGPKGVGALYVRRRSKAVRIEPLQYGGGQERGLRSGTLNVAAIVGMGAAAELAVQELAEEVPRVEALRNWLWEHLNNSIEGVSLNGPPLTNSSLRLINNLNVSVSGVDGGSLLATVEASGLAISSGSACASASPRPSHVLRAIGLNDDAARSSLRFGLSRFTTKEDCEKAVERIVDGIKKIRS